MAVVIAVDGPAASGKGTLARRLAAELGYAYLDTGLLYRAVGLSLILARYSRLNWRRLLLVVAALPLALLCNTLRVFVLVVAAHQFGTGLLDTAFHGASGVATFWLVLMVLFSMSDRETLREALA